MKKFFQDKYLPIILGVLSFIGGIIGVQNSPLININVNTPPQQDIISKSDKFFLAGQKLDEGFALHNQGKYQAAIKLYNEALSINPNYAQAYNNRGVAYKYLKHYNEAISDFNKSIELKNPALHFVYNNRGIAYFDLQNYEQAISDYNRAIEINPKYAEAYYNRGLLYQILDETEKANADFAKAKQLGLKN